MADPPEFGDEPFALLATAIEGPPDGAPPEFKDLYVRIVDAVRRGQCEECLARVVISEQTERSLKLSMDHLPTCPLHLETLKALAVQLGYAWNGPHVETVDLTEGSLHRTLLEGLAPDLDLPEG